MKSARMNKPREVEKELDTKAVESIRARICHTLWIYPGISPTMLQGGLGPTLKPAIWRPILQKLIDDGVVVEDHTNAQTPHNRFQTYSHLRLSPDQEKLQAQS